MTKSPVRRNAISERTALTRDRRSTDEPTDKS
jgi:hypothetical protein